MSPTSIHHPHARRSLLLGVLAAVGLALSFLAGRASVSHAQVHAAPAPSREAAPEGPRQPWAERGFRDDETGKSFGPSPDTNP